MNRFAPLVVAMSILGGCASDERGAGGSGGEAGTSATGGGETGVGGAGGGVGPSRRSGSFSGIYEVPVPPELEAAASYAVARIDWLIDGDTVRLDYDLPLGLVGKELHVSFEGIVDADGASATLTGNAGTAKCSILASRVVCKETMYGLLPIDVDLAIVEEIAAAEYDGPVQDRLDVAQRFSGDPIGIAHVDLDAPAR